MAPLTPEQLARWYEQEAVRAERRAASAPPSARDRWLHAAAGYRVDAESCRLGREDLKPYGGW